MIVMTEAQLAYVEKDWGLMEPWLDAVISHNIEYHRHCVADKK